VSIAIDLQSRLQRVGASVRRILEIVEEKQALPQAATKALGETRCQHWIPLGLVFV